MDESVPLCEAEALREDARLASLEAERLRRLVERMVPRAEMEVLIHNTQETQSEGTFPPF
jgi:nitrogen-specific signal transduction histidine kinase